MTAAPHPLIELHVKRMIEKVKKKEEKLNE